MTGLIYFTLLQLASNSEKDNADIGPKLCMYVYMWVYAFVRFWPADNRYAPRPFPPVLSSTGWLITKICISQCLLSADFLLGLTNGTHQ